MPTHIITKHIQEFATVLRNQEDYDDFDYGTEPIPGDKTWVKQSGCGACKSCSCKLKNKAN